MNDNTTLGKSIKVLAYLALTNAIMAILAYVTAHQELYSPLWVSLANIGLVAGKNLLDPKIKNW